MKNKRLLAILCALTLTVCGLSHALTSAQQSSNSFTLKQVLSSPFPSDLIAAPKGERIAWAFDAEGKRNIWGAEGPEFKARQLTQYNEDTGQELTDLAFTYDGNWVVYVRGGNPNSVGEIPNPTSDPMGAAQAIYAVSFTDGRVRKLSDGDSPVVSPADSRVVFSKDGQIYVVEIGGAAEPHQYFAARGTNRSPQWSPDGRKLAFVSNRSSHSFIGVFDTEKRTMRYISPSVDRDTTPRWSLDGKRLAFIRQPARGNQSRAILQDMPDPWAIWVADAETGMAKEVWRSGNKMEDSLPRMAGADVLNWAAEDRLVFASEMDGWQRLYSIQTMSGEVTALTPPKCEWEHMSLSPNKHEVFYSSNCEDINRRHIWKTGIAGGETRPMNSGLGIEWSPVLTANGQYLAYIASDAAMPAAVQVVSAKTGPRPISVIPKPFDFPKGLVQPKEVIFKAADGLDIHGQLFLPHDAKPDDKLPAVIFMHGGPVRQMLLGWHNMYYYHNAYGFNQYLASKGYAVLSVNYRAGVGYGRAFREAPKRGARGASEYLDVVAGANYLRSRNDIDQTKIGLWGGSYGGFLTALGLARNSDLFAVGVDIHGVHDWAARFTPGDAGDRDAVKIAREASPMGSVEKWRSPVLLIHGDDDRNVDFSQTVNLVRKLRDLKVEHEVIVIPDEIHDFLLHRTWLEIYDAAAKFLDQHLKGAGSNARRISKVDTLIRSGSVIDGTGNNAVKADVGILGDRIVFVGDSAKQQIEAARVVDATGLVVAPGFIDPHTHATEDLGDPKRKANLPFLFQGVTTVIVGNDGRSPLPVGKALDQWQQQGIGTNVALLVGHGSVRGKVLGTADVQPTADQMLQMKQLVRQAMDEGAFGMSTGLYYAPGSFAKTEEVIELAKIVADRGGIYDSHMRDESSYNIGLLGSIEEVIRIGREAHLPVHISHIKALGADVWGQSAKAIELIDRARSEGVNITANQYPYIASGTGITASLVPRWAEDGGNQQLLRRIADPSVRPRLVAEMEKNLKRRGGPESLLITSAKDRSLVGRRLDSIARAWQKTPIEAALDIIKTGGASVASFNMQEQDIENFMRQPWVMTGSDGSSGHPRKYGTYPRKIREYVLNRQVISLPRMIQASSLQVAETFGLKNRGKLCSGCFADVIVFDEKTINERATYEQPELLADGMKFVIVNGQLAIEGGKYTQALAGKVMRKSINGE